MTAAVQTIGQNPSNNILGPRMRDVSQRVTPAIIQAPMSRFTLFSFPANDIVYKDMEKGGKNGLYTDLCYPAPFAC